MGAQQANIYSESHAQITQQLEALTDDMSLVSYRGNAVMS